MKQQLYNVKFSLGGTYKALTDVEYNEQLLQEGVHNVTVIWML
jgi:hypothetical protein